MLIKSKVFTALSTELDVRPNPPIDDLKCNSTIFKEFSYSDIYTYIVVEPVFRGVSCYCWWALVLLKFSDRG